MKDIEINVQVNREHLVIAIDVLVRGQYSPDALNFGSINVIFFTDCVKITGYVRSNDEFMEVWPKIQGAIKVNHDRVWALTVQANHVKEAIEQGEYK